MHAPNGTMLTIKCIKILWNFRKCCLCFQGSLIASLSKLYSIVVIIFKIIIIIVWNNKNELNNYYFVCANLVSAFSDVRPVKIPKLHNLKLA